MHRITSDSGRKRRAVASLIWLESTLLEPSRVADTECRPLERSSRKPSPGRKPPPRPRGRRGRRRRRSLPRDRPFTFSPFPRASSFSCTFIPSIPRLFVVEYIPVALLHCAATTTRRLDYTGSLIPELANFEIVRRQRCAISRSGGREGVSLSEFSISGDLRRAFC